GTILVVIAFVLMTGAEASVVRAAIMGCVAAIAPFVGRIYAPRNSIILAALVMALWNPNILLRDLGFQLSFLALLGIIYLAPALTRFFRVKEKGFLNWKENLITTLSAQLMVTPLLIAVFGSVSATSLLSNLLILELIPFTMFLGFILGIVNLFSQTLGLLIAWITLVPLKAELGIIKIFSVFTIPLTPALTAGGITIYYLALIVFIWRKTKFKTQAYYETKTTYLQT
ncbi:MAG: ComEC/Rec2 family competence protein, partial [Nanoarchaeota archaeon]|nr:ComEC/Rec2 family competence protein [Nanoarchaeota archaeon]